MKSIFSGIGLVILVLSIFLFSVSGGLIYKYYMAPVHGKVDAEWQIESADNRIQKYNHFFDMCSKAKTMKASIVSQESLLKDAETVKERGRIRTNLAGMQAQLSRIVNQYNTDSKKNYTAARFKDSGLPYTLSVKGETQC